jgi:glycosyltransferase involved in cell wall biosynthesis
MARADTTARSRLLAPADRRQRAFSRVKILFHHRIASRDGQAVHMDELIAALKRLGHDIVVVGPARTARLEFGDDDNPVAFLKRGLPPMLYEMLEFAYNLVAIPRLWQAIRQQRPDAVYERYNLFFLTGPLLCRLHAIPLLLEVNAPICEERIAIDGLVLRRLAIWTQRTAWRSAEFVLPVTEVLAGYVRRAGVAVERIDVIPNGIDAAKFADLPSRETAKQALGLSGKLVLGFTGFVREWNGLDRVVDLLAVHGAEFDLHLLLVGDGPARAELVRRADRAGVAARMTITGIVSREQIGDHIAAFDIALQPGVTPYASPLKLFEYMAAGLAIVAPDQPNIREILTDRADALLIDSARPETLAAAISELCRDDGLRARLGAAARATIDRRGLTWLTNARRVTTLIAGLGVRGVTKRAL